MLEAFESSASGNKTKIRARGRVARRLHDRERYDEADALHLSNLTHLAAFSQKGITFDSYIHFGYAVSLAKQERFEDALPVAEEALSLRQKEFPEDRTEFIEEFELLEEFHAGLGNEEVARTFVERKRETESAHREAIRKFQNERAARDE